MKRVRGGRGLGDALYVRVVADYLARTLNEPVIALSGYTDVFIGSSAKVQPRESNGGNVVAHYVTGRSRKETTQWQDVLKSAGISEPVPLRMPWAVRNTALVDDLKRNAAGRPIIVVHGGREPMDRKKDGFGIDLMPTKAAFDAVLGELADCYIVQIGKADQIYPLKSDIDLNGGTTVSDLLDLVSVCDGVVAQCSFAIPMAEVFDKPLLAIWSASHTRAMWQNSPNNFIRQATPQKVLSSERDSFVMDDWPIERLQEAARALCCLA